jgi:mRNA interferase YafQ
MLSVIRSNKFKKDYKLAMKRGLDMSLLDEIMIKLAQKEPLDAKHNDHSIIGEWVNSRECHIKPDWLLIYTLKDNEIVFERTGTHSDLF